MYTVDIYKAVANPIIAFSYPISKPALATEDHLTSCYDICEMAPAAAGSCVFAGLYALENDFTRALQ